MQGVNVQDKERVEVKKVDLEVTGSRLVIDFKRTDLSTETLLERAEEVLPLLIALISADDTLCRLTDEEFAERDRAWQAMDLMCQAATQSATRRAELLEAIASGKESIAAHGFPEFSGEKSVDV
ncbi:hypothetical protein BMI87_10165 [Thioclava sp. F28-4]|nr:hypothetical protein BMI87_10165 [Thioclava sp. F28-4]